MRDPESGEPIALATIQRDISERLAADERLQDLADLRRDLLARLVQAQEDERARIAGDVHDDSVQVLAAVEIRLGLLRRQLEEVDPGAAEKVDPVHEVVAGAIERLRHLLFDLESPALESNLGSALDQAASFVLGDEVRWWFTGDHDLELPPELRVTAYRIAKEAMNNVVKHAGAHEVVIDLRSTDDGIQLTLDDNGRGFDPDGVPDLPGHLGLPGMRDRATIAGGGLEVGPRPGGGTRVRLWLPRGGPGA
jgi:signal transduction histidine kinase